MVKEIYLAGGCFWGVEKYLSLIKGVVDTSVGYANGTTEDPTYEEVCYCDTGHVEAVKVVYDDERISLRHLLRMFYEVIDPTSVNRQGNDRGTQYRTGVYYVDEADISTIEASLLELGKCYGKPLAIEVRKLENYSRAEDDHQHYLDKNPQGYCHIGPQKFRDAATMKSEI